MTPTELSSELWLHYCNLKKKNKKRFMQYLKWPLGKIGVPLYYNSGIQFS